VQSTVTKQYKFGTSPSWEGNRRSGVALAMRKRQQWYYHLQGHVLRRETSTTPML